MGIQLNMEPGGMVLTSPFNRRFVDDLKDRIPATLRKWDNDRKVWVFDADAFTSLAPLVQFHFGVKLQKPFTFAAAAPTVRILKVEYMGQCKSRGDGEMSAFGYVDGDWKAVFPEAVLRKWFASPARPGGARTLYGILGVKDDSAESEIKSAYRRLVRQWHPDVCHELDAAEQFIKIQAAYETLADPLRRKKYDAGLLLEASLKSNVGQAAGGDTGLGGFRSPLRCGYVLVGGQERLGRFIVSEIMQWEDITDGIGRTLVTSWNVDAKTIDHVWV